MSTALAMWTCHGDDIVSRTAYNSSGAPRILHNARAELHKFEKNGDVHGQREKVRGTSTSWVTILSECPCGDGSVEQRFWYLLYLFSSRGSSCQHKRHEAAENGVAHDAALDAAAGTLGQRSLSRRKELQVWSQLGE